MFYFPSRPSLEHLWRDRVQGALICFQFNFEFICLRYDDEFTGREASSERETKGKLEEIFPLSITARGKCGVFLLHSANQGII